MLVELSGYRILVTRVPNAPPTCICGARLDPDDFSISNRGQCPSCGQTGFCCVCGTRAKSGYYCSYACWARSKAGRQCCSSLHERMRVHFSSV
jgi:hypothetical protein